MIALLAASVLAQAHPIQVDYELFGGLQIRAHGIPVVQGSAWQYYEVNWTKGIYSSYWRPKTIERLANAGIRVRFVGDDGRVTGTITFTRLPDGVKGDYQFQWLGSKEIRLENNLGLIWGPAVDKGTLDIDGKMSLPLNQVMPQAAKLEERMFGPPGSRFLFDSPFATLEVTADPPGAVVFDARSYQLDWALNRETFWLGYIDQKLPPNGTLRYSVTWRLTPKPKPPAYRPVETTAADTVPLRAALSPSQKALPLIPRPKQVESSNSMVALPQQLRFELPSGQAGLQQEFEASLWRRWERESVQFREGRYTIVGRIANLDLPSEGYTLSVEDGQTVVTGQDEAGLRHGLRSLVWLFRAENGRLMLPKLRITDWPSLKWRGLHMFVGPTALPFQTKMMDTFFAPLKINKAVIQCERATWKAIAGTEIPITMRKEDLIRLFANYRARGIEPIPLIQSLGHAGWMFSNGKNLDIAINPNEPFTMDPRKDRTRQVLRDLWSEAIDALQPKMVHFGMDEIDMRGLPDDPGFTTRLWNRHIPWLMDLAKEKRVEAMIWGDIMLHSSEAPDATHAETKEEAKSRRGVVSKETWVADWHYKNDANPDIYKSLSLFQGEGMKPVAATWWRPNNIRGFALAAVKSGAPGLLQTTWAGYESSEPAMIREFHQFSAYVLAADYAWSGRQEMPDKLPYNPQDVLMRLYFAPPEPVSPIRGQALTPMNQPVGEEFRIGPAAFRRLPRTAGLSTPLDAQAATNPDELVYRLNLRSRELMLAVDCLAWVRENEELAEVLVKTADQRIMRSVIRYGEHARMARDARPTLLSPRQSGLSAFRMSLMHEGEASRITEVKVRRLHPAAGLRVHALTAVSP